MSEDSEDESTALINEAKKKSDTKTVTKYSRAIDGPSKITNGSSEETKWKQSAVFSKLIKAQQEIERKNVKELENPFLN